jgi:hypothetical protein
MTLDRKPTLGDVPEGDPILRTIGGVGSTMQILMRRMTCVDGLEVALGPVFEVLANYHARFAAAGALIRASCRTCDDGQNHGDRRSPLGFIVAAERILKMEKQAEGEPTRPLAVALDPVDPTVGEDAAWCARALAVMYADWGVAERPDERNFAAEDVSRFLRELAEELHYERDADAIAAIDRAVDRLEAWRATGE